MAESVELLIQEAGSLEAHCNKTVNGECRTLACLQRGGHVLRSGPPDSSIATCPELEKAGIKRRTAELLQQQEAEINRLRAQQAPVPDADEQPNDEEETQYDRDMADYDRNPALTAEQRNSWTRA